MGHLTNHVILQEYKLIVECFCGDIGPNEIIAQKLLTLNDPFYNSRYSLLEDFRNAQMIQTPKRIAALVDWLKETSADRRNTAILTDRPEQVVAAELFAAKSAELPMNMKVFSTLAAALFWLGVKQLNDRSMEELIRTMKAAD